MKVTINTNSPKDDLKMKILYRTIKTICAIAIILTLYVIISKNVEDMKKNENIVVSEEEYIKMEEEFETIFLNKTINQIDKNILITNKIKQDDDIIGIAYESGVKVIGKYSLDVKIPYININNATVEKYNNQIEQIFKQKALDIVESNRSEDVVYTVDYVAYINENDILSIAIRSILKEGNNAQRTIIQTYNYDFKNNKEVTLGKILEMKKLEEKDVQSKVEKKIKQEEEKAKELYQLGYHIFQRDHTDEMYNLNNTTEFFMGKDGFLYLIYAYGNDNYTSELDVVIF